MSLPKRRLGDDLSAFVPEFPESCKICILYKDVVLIHFPSQVYGGFSFRVVLAACFGLQLVWTSVPSPFGSNWKGEIYHNSSRITRFLFRFCVSIQ